MIQTNELANDLTSKLRITEEEIKLKEEYEQAIKDFSINGFRESEKIVHYLVSSYNHLSWTMLSVHYLENMGHWNDERGQASLILKHEGVGAIWRKEFGYIKPFTGPRELKEMRDKLYEDLLKSIISIGIDGLVEQAKQKYGIKDSYYDIRR